MNVASLWIGDRLGPCEELCLASHLAVGHRVTLYAYRRTPVPRGVALANAAQLVRQPRWYRYKGSNSAAPFADYFRLLLLQARDVTWVDTDILALRPFDFSRPYLFGRTGAGDVASRINNAVLRAPPDSELLARLTAVCREPHLALAYLESWRRDAARKRYAARGNWDGVLPWGSLGYVPLTAEIVNLGLPGFARPAHEFYGLEGPKLFAGGYDYGPALRAGALAAHFTTSWMVKRGIDPLRPVPGSFYHACVRRYGRLTSYFQTV